jgi:hypothetical protein
MVKLKHYDHKTNIFRVEKTYQSYDENILEKLIKFFISSVGRNSGIDYKKVILHGLNPNLNLS